MRTQRPEIPIVLIADLQHTVSVGDLAGRLSLAGYIPTTSTLGVASAALRLILAGGKYLPPTNQPAETPARPLSVKLTPREQVVLDLLEHGLPNKTIGKRLGMSPSTVKAHVHNIISKLNVRNRTEAAVARYINSASPAAVPPAAEGALADVIRLRR